MGPDAANLQSIAVTPNGGFVVVQESDNLPPHLGEENELDGFQGTYDRKTDTVYVDAVVLRHPVYAPII